MLQNVYGNPTGSVPTLKQNNHPFLIDNSKSTNQIINAPNNLQKGNVQYYEPRQHVRQTGSFHQSPGHYSYNSPGQSFLGTGMPPKTSQ